MRTTLDIDDAVLAAVKELARRQSTTAGAVISALVRQALTRPQYPETAALHEAPAIYGFRPLAAADRLVTDDLVDKLRDEHGI